MFTYEQIEEAVEILGEAPNSKLYFGCDSNRYKKNGQWHAKYATVFVIHKDQSRGCRILYNISDERDYDLKPGRPKMRLMKEVQKVCELYVQLAPFIDQFDVEIHLDISKDPVNGSNCVYSEAVGFAIGMSGLPDENIKTKSDSWAATHAADMYCN